MVNKLTETGNATIASNRKSADRNRLSNYSPDGLSQKKDNRLPDEIKVYGGAIIRKATGIVKLEPDGKLIEMSGTMELAGYP